MPTTPLQGPPAQSHGGTALFHEPQEDKRRRACEIDHRLHGRAGEGYPVAGVFTYVHDYKATTTFLEKTVEMTPEGMVKVDKELATSTEGIFACGDVLCGRPQIPAIAAAQGLLAGISVDKYMSSAKS